MISFTTEQEIQTISTSSWNGSGQSVYSELTDLSIVENLQLSRGTYIEYLSQPSVMSLFIITQGTGTIDIDQQKVEVKENSLILMVSGSLKNAFIEQESFKISGVSFSRDFLKGSGVMADLNPRVFECLSSNSFLMWKLEEDEMNMMEHEIHLLSQQAKELESHPFGKDILVHGLYIFLLKSSVLRHKTSNVGPLTFSRPHILVNEFLSLAKQQFREVRTIKEYADQLNVSAKYLTELVKKHTGENASKVISHLVINEAKFLLSKPVLSIGQIADQLYFSDQSFFGKYFKRQTGLSPKEFRESEEYMPQLLLQASGYE